MEVLERFGLLGCYVVELGLAIQLFFDLAAAMHRADLSSGSTTQLAVFLRETTLVPAELVDI